MQSADDDGHLLHDGSLLTVGQLQVAVSIREGIRGVFTGREGVAQRVQHIPELQQDRLPASFLQVPPVHGDGVEAHRRTDHNAGNDNAKHDLRRQKSRHEADQIPDDLLPWGHDVDVIVLSDTGQAGQRDILFFFLALPHKITYIVS